jgi:phytoene synthase
LLALDVRLAEIVRQAREPMLGQIRLAWWRDLLSRDPADWPQGEPLVRHIADHLANSAPALAAMATGWEFMLSAEALSRDQLTGYLTGRAGGYAAVAAKVAEGTRDRDAEAAATWWILGDTCTQLSREDEQAHLRDLARETHALRHRFEQNQRPLAVLAALGKRAFDRHEPVLEGRVSALVALRVGMFGR